VPYALQLQGPGAQFFALDQNTGVPLCGRRATRHEWASAFWDYPSFSLNVPCYDLSPAPLTTSQTITVVITPVNTMAITGFGLPSSTDPSAGITLSPGAIAFTTIGNTTIEIYGRGFGPTQRRLNESASSAVAVTASYGPTQPLGARSTCPTPLSAARRLRVSAQGKHGRLHSTGAPCGLRPLQPSLEMHPRRHTWLLPSPA